MLAGRAVETSYWGEVELHAEVRVEIRQQIREGFGSQLFLGSTSVHVIDSSNAKPSRAICANTST